MPEVLVRAIKPIHPFPARMAAEIALGELESLAPGSLVLDPMAGSGTVLRAASEWGHQAVGFDVDPLAVLMAKVWTTPIEPDELRAETSRVVACAQALDPAEIRLPWIDEDEETAQFVDYWFAARQQETLRKISYSLRNEDGTIGDALRVALSRIIVTKDRGASLARDVSHGRPHRVMDDSDYNVLEGFSRSAERVAKLLEEQPPPGGVDVISGDVRELAAVRHAVADAAITSPPYLNAIDYLRGHRLSLVWLGHRIGELRLIRSESIGSERAPSEGADDELAKTLVASLGDVTSLPRKIMRMIERYALDLFFTVKELSRVVRPGGKAVLVIGNSTLRGVFVENASIICAVAELAGLELVGRHERELPASRRYLPPPSTLGDSHFTKRMRTETVLTYQRP